MAVYLPEAAYSSEQLAELSQAIQIFERVLPQYDVYFEHSSNELAKWTNGREVNTTLTIRDKVIAATKADLLTVPEIEKKTGLIGKKIRGVLTAPDLVFKRTKSNGETRYQFEKTIPRPNPAVPREITTENPKIR